MGVEPKETMENNNTEVDVKKITEAVNDVSVSDNDANTNNGNNSGEMKKDENNETTGITIQITEEMGETKMEDETSHDETTEVTIALESVSDV